MPSPNYVMNRFFMLLLLVAIAGMFVYHESEESTVTQEEALTFQEFLAKQPEETPTETPRPTKVPGFSRPMFHAEGDDDPKPKGPRKLSFEAINGEDDKWDD